MGWTARTRCGRRSCPCRCPSIGRSCSKQSGAGAAAPFRITDLLVDEARRCDAGVRGASPLGHRATSVRHAPSVVHDAARGGRRRRGVDHDLRFAAVPPGRQDVADGGTGGSERRPARASRARHPAHGRRPRLRRPRRRRDVSAGRRRTATARSCSSIRTAPVRPFSIGHRNQQGLAIDTQGRIWSTEHGPEGGDELNLIVDGGNYGWPLASYGAEYGTDNWPFAVNAKNHGEYREPAHAFVPSIGVSQLIQITSMYLPRWTDDLLVSSLQAGRLFRVRVSGERVIYAESIDLSMRIRDLVEARDGRIVLWNDDGQMATLALAPPGKVDLKTGTRFGHSLPHVEAGEHADANARPRRHHRDVEGHIEGTFRQVTPPAIASATPAGVTFGPRPNSTPDPVRRPTSQLTLGMTMPCSRPPARKTHSFTAERPLGPVLIRFSNCQPNCEKAHPASIWLFSQLLGDTGTEKRGPDPRSGQVDRRQRSRRLAPARRSSSRTAASPRARRPRVERTCASSS